MDSKWWVDGRSAATNGPEDVLRWASSLREELGDEVPPVLSAILDRATRADPSERYRSAAELLAALRLLERATTTPSPTPSAREWSTGAVIAARGIGWLLLVIGLASAGMHVERRSPPRVVVVPLDRRTAPVPEPVLADGVHFTAEGAASALSWVNGAPEEDLAAAGIAVGPRRAILLRRPFAELALLAETPGIGSATMRRIADHHTSRPPL